MTAQHSPAPWRYAPFGLQPAVVDATGGFICQVSRHPGAPGLGEANARLIAAAPDLLKALTAALEVIEGEYPSDDYIAAPIMSQCRAAIAQAKGE